MNAATRRRRAVLRDRRRGYGPDHALLCRCPECVDYGPFLGSPADDAPFSFLRNLTFTFTEPADEEEEEGEPILSPLTGYDLYLASQYGPLRAVAQLVKLPGMSPEAMDQAVTETLRRQFLPAEADDLDRPSMWGG